MFKKQSFLFIIPSLVTSFAVSIKCALLILPIPFKCLDRYPVAKMSRIIQHITSSSVSCTPANQILEAFYKLIVTKLGAKWPQVSICRRVDHTSRSGEKQLLEGL